MRLISTTRYKLIGLGIVTCLWVANTAQADTYDIHKAVNAKLTYAASKFFISVETEVSQKVITQEQAQQEMLPAPKGEAWQPAAEGVIKQSIVSDILGTRSQFDIWLNPDAQVLQRTSLYTGNKDWYRNFRYLHDGAYSIKRHPHDGNEEAKPWSQWSEVNEDFYKVSDKAKGLVLSEAESIFYLVNVADLRKPGDVVVQHLFDSDGVITVTLTAKDIVPLGVKFKETDAQGNSHEVKEQMKALHAHVVSTPFDPNANTANFKFLGYKGDIDLYIDPVRHIMVQATGKLDYIGTLNIRLKEADFSN